MSHIVCGRFDRTVDADAALEALKSEGFRREEVDSFYVTPPGQHAELLLGGDAYSDAGARQGGRGAAFGVVAGALIGGIAGFVLNQLLALPYVWVGVLLGAALGAYVGSLAGAMKKLHGGRHDEATPEHPVESRGGRMIAVLAERPGTEPRAVELLKRHGARDVGRTEGTWRDGSWRDFDPRQPLATV